MIDQVDKKYFKLAVGKLKKENNIDCSVNCPSCGDTKGRLHLYKNSGMEIALVHCYNAGCIFDEQQMGMVKFLNSIRPELTIRYKKERFGDIMKDITKETKSLNDLLSEVKQKAQETQTALPVPIEKQKTAILSPLVIHPFFLDGLMRVKDNKEAVTYLENRKIDIEDDWYFSENDFINYFDKSYYVKDFFFIPLWHERKLSGFYTRSINEKRFSTIIFPDKEKYWCSKDLDYSKPVYIFEGIIDALSSGLDNVAAMLSADLPKEFLSKIDPIFCFDNDKTGHYKAIKYIKMKYKVFVWPDNDHKDMNSLLQSGEDKENIKNMILNNIHFGIQALILTNLSNL